MTNNQIDAGDEPPDDTGLHRDSDLPLNDAVATDSPPPVRRQAAVLIPFVLERDEWHVLFIRRATRDGDRHSGQVAFPGGARDRADNSLATTALREAEEEIGIDRRDITLLGELNPYVTVSDFEVTAHAGVLRWPRPLTLQESEVAHAFTVPLDWLRQRDNFELRERRELDRHSDRRHPIVVYRPYEGETLWGATARMMLNCLKALDDERIVLPRPSP